MRGDSIIPFPAPPALIPLATFIRSTWVVSSLQSLREASVYDRYLPLLAAEHERAVLDCVAGTWLPFAAAHAHYDACERMGLGVEEVMAVGRAVGKRGHGALLATIVKAAAGVGVTPWSVLSQFDRIWARGFVGGAVAVSRLGPKEARLELVRCTLLDIAYFRNGLRGFLLGNSSMFCAKMYIRELPMRRPATATYQMQWA